MKLLFFSILSTLFISNYTISQESIQKVIPNQVTHSFEVNYPAIKVRKWTVKNNMYEARFVNDHKKCMAYYDSNGEWIKTQTIILWSWNLPLPVKQSFYKSQFAIWFIEKMQKCETPKQTFYRFLINNGNLLDADHHDAFMEKYSLDFSTNGELIDKRLAQ